MNQIVETDDVDYVIAIDTDSLYINFGPMVEKFGFDKNGKSECVDILSKIAAEKFEPMFEKAYDDLAKYMNAYANRMGMDREVIADAGIWTAKKRYILNMHDKEGVRYKTPKLKIMGIEAVKSSTPNSCREALKELFKVIISSSESEVQDAIKTFKQHFKTLPPHEIAFPRGVKEINKWVDRNIKYKSGTPIHVRGSILYNNVLVDKDLKKRYDMIKEGEKIKFIYLKQPNSIGENIIAFPDYLPEEFGLHKYVDYELQFDKAFLKVVEPVLSAIGWSVEPRVSLDEFFS
jgi:DNA polymerase elongation subunit (family B)